MLIIETTLILRREIKRLKQEGKRIALVPTMGNLHQGHLKLIEEARIHADVVIASIFVNPMQFDREADLANYPRTLQEDCELLRDKHVDIVFAPSAKEMYPNGMENQTIVEVPVLSSVLEGASRPGHFRGVTTVVSKLFNLVQPDVALFGEKDYQQLQIIKKWSVIYVLISVLFQSLLCVIKQDWHLALEIVCYQIMKNNKPLCFIKLCNR